MVTASEEPVLGNANAPARVSPLVAGGPDVFGPWGGRPLPVPRSRALGVVVPTSGPIQAPSALPEALVARNFPGKPTQRNRRPAQAAIPSPRSQGIFRRRPPWQAHERKSEPRRRRSGWVV